MKFLKMEDLDLAEKRVLIREDFNVPINNGKILNDARIKAALPTIKLAQSSARSIILMSHLGRPSEGEPISEQSELSLAPIARYLSVLLDCQVPLISDYLNALNFLAIFVMIFYKISICV